MADGGATWAILRVGPFSSTGGYDWWQFAAHDALNLSRRLEGGRTLALHSHYVVGVRAEDGGVLGYPPLHMHHLHVHPYHDHREARDKLLPKRVNGTPPLKSC